MMMTPQQIVLEYERTINQSTGERNREIKRLADVNECDKKEIVAILRNAGCELPGWYTKERKPFRLDSAAVADEILNGPKAEPAVEPAAEPEPEAAQEPEAVSPAPQAEAEDEDYVPMRNALPLISAMCTVRAIQRALDNLDERAKAENADRNLAVIFAEQVRGILMLGDEIVTRCEEVEG